MRNSYLSAPPITDLDFDKLTELHPRVQEWEGNTVGEVFASMRACQCCPRHQISKPATMHIALPSPGSVSPWVENTCACECRFLSRWIVRFCTEENVCQAAEEEM
jgi:hypothetical protein